MRLFAFLFLALSLLVAMPAPAHAYLDPGSGSMLLQALLGGIAGVAVFVKMYWRRIVARFRSDKTPAESE